MRAQFAIVGGKAKQREAIAGPTRPQSGAIIAAFLNLFPQHARKTLARLFGISESAARKKLEGERTLSLDEFCELLHTDHGFRYLTAVMADSEVRWWRICRPMMEVAEVQAMQIAARRRLTKAVKGAFDADADITAARARADALLVQDENFYGEHAAALRSIGGVSHSAVAKTAK